jgi:ornithine cyclodeaminase/alanine dehydrogenase-like protein (mu-crystallin family)
MPNATTEMVSEKTNLHAYVRRGARAAYARWQLRGSFSGFRLASLELASAMRTVVDRVHPIVVTVRHAANVVLGTLLEAGVHFEAAAASRFGVVKLAQKVLQETTTVDGG